VPALCAKLLRMQLGSEWSGDPLSGKAGRTALAIVSGSARRWLVNGQQWKVTAELTRLHQGCGPWKSSPTAINADKAIHRGGPGKYQAA